MSGVQDFTDDFMVEDAPSECAWGALEAACVALHSPRPARRPCVQLADPPPLPPAPLQPRRAPPRSWRRTRTGWRSGRSRWTSERTLWATSATAPPCRGACDWRCCSLVRPGLSAAAGPQLNLSGCLHPALGDSCCWHASCWQAAELQLQHEPCWMQVGALLPDPRCPLPRLSVPLPAASGATARRSWPRPTCTRQGGQEPVPCKQPMPRQPGRPAGARTLGTAAALPPLGSSAHSLACPLRLRSWCLSQAGLQQARV